MSKGECSFVTRLLGRHCFRLPFRGEDDVQPLCANADLPRHSEHCCEQGGSGGEVLYDYGFVAGVGAFADCAHAVEGGNAEG